MVTEISDYFSSEYDYIDWQQSLFIVAPDHTQ
jgi:hypothetical protein